MNATVIILGVVVVVVLYLVYLYVYSTTSKLAIFIDCTTQQQVIVGSSLPSPTSLRFAYGAWIYVQNWQGGASSTSNYLNIFYRAATTANIYSTLHVYMSGSTPSLYVDFIDGTINYPGTATPSNNQLLVTTNFPLQKWVCLVVSFDSNNCDVYLDGKMVVTAVVPSITAQPDATGGVFCGPFGGYIGNLTNWSTGLDPQSVWNYYLKGNGSSALGNSYGLQVDVLSNGQVSKSMQLI